MNIPLLEKLKKLPILMELLVVHSMMGEGFW